MNKNKLLKFFRTNEAIGEITNQFKQNVHKTVEFTHKDKVKSLLKALDIRYKELTEDYKLLKEQGERVLRDAKIKAKQR